MPEHQYQPSIPKYGLHKASGQARVVIGGRQYYLGRHGSAESRQLYDRLVAEWLTAGRRAEFMPDGRAVIRPTVTDLIAAYRDHCEVYYQKGGRPTRTLANIRCALRRLRRLM